ncbi:MAG TPA: hypothetical protein IAB20_03595 [Candidatus Pullichristensenella excrementipullorum]|nr:hypothetical protein [Candidatus Pullichristensenella excrementipullorum]
MARLHLKLWRFSVPEDGVEEQKIMLKTQYNDVYGRPSALTDVLRPCHARLKPQGKPRCACLERLHLKPGRFFVPEDGMKEWK